MQWRVGLENYEVMATHGYYDEEHHAPQPFIVTVWATLSHHGAIECLHQTLNYADIQIAVDEVLLNSPTPLRLMEDMARQIIELLSAHQSIASLSITIAKPQAPLPHPGGLPIIQMEWQRN